MKICIYSYWKNRWVYYLKNYFTPKGYDVQYSSVVDTKLLEWADINYIAWANEMAVQITHLPTKHGKYIVCVRGYEVFGDFMKQIKWDVVDDVIFTNDWFIGFAKQVGMKMSDEHIHWLVNGVETELWKKQEHTAGNKIAIVANINHKKEFPLAMQVMAKLPEQYTMHIVGFNQDWRYWLYMGYIATEMKLGNRVVYEGFMKTPQDLMNWLTDKNYILSCSPTEGSPNNLLESMSLGIKPVIHNWCGAKHQFPTNLIFNTIDEAVDMITGPDYDSSYYHQYIVDNYDISKVYPKLEKIITKKEVSNGK